MQLQDDEYIIVRDNGEDSIFISQKTLEKWRKKYNDRARTSVSMSAAMYYSGRADLLSDILIHFRLKKENENKI